MAGIFDQIGAGVKGAFRIVNTTAVLARTGFDWLLGDRLPAPALLRRTFESLGATYIKLGQFIASAPTLFPPEYVTEFQHCLDKTEPLPYSVMESVLKEEFKKPLDQIFQSIEKTPLASASIAQVHAATLKSGESVVLKIQKPGVRDVLLTDLNFLFAAAKILEFLAPGLARTSLSAIISEIQQTMMEECDFLKEAKNMEEFATFLKKHHLNSAAVPRLHRAQTTEKVIVMERFYGVPLTDLDSIRKFTKDPEKTLITAMNTWFASLMFCDFFHADVHAGNLMVLEDGRIGFIDFGIVGRIPRTTWTAMVSMMEAMAVKDYDTMALSLMQIGAADTKQDRSGFAADLKNLFESMESIEDRALRSMDILETDINRVLLDMVKLGEDHGIRFPKEFALLLKQILYFDRYVRILSPGLDLFGDERLKRLS